MKRLIYSTGIKIAAFFVVVILLCSIFAVSIGAFFMYKNDVYLDGGESFIDNVYEAYGEKYYSTVESYIDAKLMGDNTDIYDEVLSPSKTNFRYIAMSKGQIIGKNYADSDDVYLTGEVELQDFEAYDPNEIKRDAKVFANYVVLNEYLNEFEDKESDYTAYKIIGYDIKDTSGSIRLDIRYLEGRYRQVKVGYGALTEPIVKDSLYYGLKIAEIGISERYNVFIYIGIAFVLCVFLLIVLMCGVGHKNGHDGVYICRFNRIPLDLYVALNIAAVYYAVIVFNEIVHSDVSAIICLCVLVPIFASMLLGLILTFSARLKKDGWYKNTVMYFCISKAFSAIKKLGKGLFALLGKVPLFYKSLIVLVVVSFAELLFLIMGMEDYLPFWVIEKLVVTAAMIYLAICLSNLQNTAKRLSEGQTDTRVDTKYMLWDIKKHGEYLNDVGSGLAVAVEKSVKSERMKTELITNVSHDIKTPLTSIINYVDLLKRDGVNSDNAKEYLDVLERQSHRLKKLTEDLVEASKASTGNISIDIEETDINVLLEQTVGEFEDTLKEKELELICDIEEGLTANADGRRMWRVFDNLMSNICKYAQPKTRVYISSKKQNGRVVTVFKNISKTQLNIDPDELTERFVRGDVSRNTDGSGLGLSIARSLTELQGGKFEISIDGDLFKVTVIL